MFIFAENVPANLHGFLIAGGLDRSQKMIR